MIVRQPAPRLLRRRVLRFGPPPFHRPRPVITDGALRPALIRNDGVRIQGLGHTRSLGVIGTLAGVRVLDAAGRNGPGIGTLKVAEGSKLSWRAPGSNAFGSSTLVTADGAVLVEDGEDESRYLRVYAYLDYLEDEAEARIYLQDLWPNDLIVGLGFDDYSLGTKEVTAAQASSGVSQNFELEVANYGPMDALRVRVWLEPVEGWSRIWLTDDPGYGSLRQPSHEDHSSAITFASIAPGDVEPLFVRRVTPASSSSDADILNAISVSWDGY